MNNGPIFQARHYNMLADVMSEALLETKPEHVKVVRSYLLRVTHKLALKNSNMQIGRFMDAAGIPRSTSAQDTRRD